MSMWTRVRGLFKLLSSIKFINNTLVIDLDCDLTIVCQNLKSVYVYRFDNCTDEFIEEVLDKGAPLPHPEIEEIKEEDLCLVQ